MLKICIILGAILFYVLGKIALRYVESSKEDDTDLFI